MDLQLTDKLALVSGSTAGIGLAIATSLATEGARVIVNGRTERRVNEAIASIRAAQPNAKLEGYTGDLTKAADAEELARQFPDVEILVNNLGIFEPKPFEEITDEEWLRFFDVNVVSGVRLSRLYLAGMRKRNWGRIVFISSESAIQPPPEMLHYGTTKTAQIAIARGLAELVAGTGITVNAVLPGPTRSEGVEAFVDKLSGGKPFDEFQTEFFEKARPTSLIKRFSTTEEIANLVTYVCSPRSSSTTGTALRAEGGLLKSPF